MIVNIKHKNISGIYCIRNIVNGKVYIGKSKNIWNRIHGHVSSLRIGNKKHENSYIQAAWNKYGENNFEYFILEYISWQDEAKMKKQEMFWMKLYKSTNREHGYNLRQDSDSNMIVHSDTSKKISERLKKEWKNGVRDQHGEKLSEAWKRASPERRLKQSEWFTLYKTKYMYNLYTLDGVFVSYCNYKYLKEINIHGVQHKFAKYKMDLVRFKEFFVKRVIIKDIVRSSEKFE